MRKAPKSSNHVYVDSRQNSFWNRITLVCGNHGKDYSHEFNIKEVNRSEFYEGRRHEAKRSDPFYSCPLYKPYYQVLEGETSCNNRISYTDFLKMLEWISNLEIENSLFGEEADIEGKSTTTPTGITFKIIKQEFVDGDPHYTVSMINKRAINS